METDKMREQNCALPDHCNKREIPLWLILLDNIPTLILFILGYLIINRISTSGAIFFGAYALLSVVWFWARICPYCPHYDTLACPCGYGVVSSRIFRRRNVDSFKKVFRRNIAVVFPNWFVPLSVAIYLLIIDFNNEILVYTISFVTTGFIIIPLISKFVGCRNCEIREDCPWMSANKVQKQ